MLKLAELIHPVDKELHIRYLHNYFFKINEVKRLGEWICRKERSLRTWAQVNRTRAI